MLTTDEVRAAFIYARNDQDYINPADEEARFDAWLSSAIAKHHPASVEHRKGLALGEIEICESCPRNVYGAQIAWDDPCHLRAVANREALHR